MTGRRGEGLASRDLVDSGFGQSLLPMLSYLELPPHVIGIDPEAMGRSRLLVYTVKTALGHECGSLLAVVDR